MRELIYLMGLKSPDIPVFQSDSSVKEMLIELM
jgi:hypothetical protein